MLTLLVVIAGALVIMAIARPVNRRGDSLSDRARTSGSDDAASSWMPMMSGADSASDCGASDGGSGCDGGGGGGE
jgi:hypothetical protein